MASPSKPPRILAATDPVDPELEPLLREPFASAWTPSGERGSLRPDVLRDRLLRRLSASRAASAAMVTSRLRRLRATALAQGVAERTLYAAPGDRPLRPGEPLAARLIELDAGACWAGPASGHHREWLVLRGRARLGDESLERLDYRVSPADADGAALSSDTGALLFLRESELPAPASDPARTVHDADSDWPDYAPGIQRRVLWQHGGQAALLYYAQPGASVPMHTHGYDEECLMVQGELFLDDILLQEGDYQLAPAGTGHRITETDTGVIIYAHGDLDLQFVR